MVGMVSLIMTYTVNADGAELCEDNMSSSEMSSALCAGIQTEIDRVFSNGIFIDNKVHFPDRVELLTELSYHTDHACDSLILAVRFESATIMNELRKAVANRLDFLLAEQEAEEQLKHVELGTNPVDELLPRKSVLHTGGSDHGLEIVIIKRLL